MKEPKYKLREVIRPENGDMNLHVLGVNLAVLDIHISPTTGQIIYECITLESIPKYPLYREEDMPEDELF